MTVNTVARPLTWPSSPSPPPWADTRGPSTFALTRDARGQWHTRCPHCASAHRFEGPCGVRAWFWQEARS